MIRNLGEKYSPLYFLASLGFGGMAVFFFMAFMHITPHPDTPMPTFESITSSYANGDAFMRAVIVIGYIGMIAMLVIHFTLLAWNFREFNAYKETAAYQSLKSSNAEVTLMAIPLTLGMTINGVFVAALALIPGLWGIIQSLMPLALLAYGAVGALALVIMTNYLRRIIAGGFSFEANGGLNQLLAAFAMSMVAVGFGAPAAMSTSPFIVLVGIFGSMLFGFISVVLFAVFLIAGVMSIMRYGLALPNSATLWLAVPILTLYSITVLRDRHGMQTLIDAGSAGLQNHPQSSVAVLLFLSFMILAQVAFLGLGFVVMRTNGFFQRFVTSREETSPVAFTLVCPGVGLAVLSMFYINVGLIQNGLVEKFSGLHYALLLGPAAVAAVTIWLAFTLFRNQLSTASKFAQEQKVLVNA